MGRSPACERGCFQIVSAVFHMRNLATGVLAGVLLLRSALLASDPSYDKGIKQGVIDTTDILEASGLIASRQNPGVLWTHNDNGFPGTIFAISTNGSLLARYAVPNVFFGDFEDISFGPGPNPDHQYVYLGDIGDNFLTRTSIRVLRFPEPAVYTNMAANPRSEMIPAAQEITLVYPDGPFNAEAMLVDPLTGDLFLATKLTNSSRIYRATRAELDGGGPVGLQFIREISFFKPSAADISADGRLIVMRRGGKAGGWARGLTQTVGDALAASPFTIPLVDEFNGESIAIHPTGLGYYTLSEGLFQTNYFFLRRTNASDPRQPVVFIKPGESWRYHDQGMDLGVAWREMNFVDTNWPAGPGQLGYGQGDEQTTVSFGEDDFDKNHTTYFRKSFSKPAATTVTNLALRLCYTDGVAVYLNGAEVYRRNVATNAGYGTLAGGAHAPWQNFWVSVPVKLALLRTGTNVVAAEVHRLDPMGADLSFDLQLGEGSVELPVRFTAKPALLAGDCRLSLAGPPGGLAVIEASADMQHWNEVGRLVLVGGVGTFQERATAAPSGRFYRVRE